MHLEKDSSYEQSHIYRRLSRFVEYRVGPRRRREYKRKRRAHQFISSATEMRSGSPDRLWQRRFFPSGNSSDPTDKREQLFEDISTVARANLNQEEITALKAAFAKGIKPLPEDNESGKCKAVTPECCRFPSQRS